MKITRHYERFATDTEALDKLMTGKVKVRLNDTEAHRHLIDHHFNVSGQKYCGQGRCCR